MKSKTLLLTTDRLELHAISVNDADALIDILTDSEVAQTYMLPKFESREDAYKCFDIIMALSLGEKFVYGIYLEDKLIGLINEVYVDGNDIELGYAISPKHKGNGYATEALKKAIEALFEMGYATVIAGAFENNVASMRVMEKSGMTKCDYTENVEYNGKTIKCIMYNIKKNPNE